MGGTVSGLAAKVTWGLVDGMGGTVSGLAIAEVATAAIAATRTVPRTLREVDLIYLYSLWRNNYAYKE